MSAAGGPAIAVLDLGSTAFKGAVAGADGSILAAASERIDRLADGSRVEHDPEALAASLDRLLDRLLARRSVGAVGLACQRSTCLLWERATGRPLTAAISWQDTRQADRVATLAPHAAGVARATGLRLSPHYAAPKLAWLLESTPGARAAAEAGEIVAGTLDAFLVHRLTGRATTEPGHAGRTLLYDLAADRWDERLCDLFGVPPAALPELAPSVAPRGEVRGVPLTAVAGDQQAALVGHGGWRSGITIAHFGTGAFVLASTGGEPRRHDGLLTAVLASMPSERRFQLEGTVNAAGSAVDWACRLTGQQLEDWAGRPIDPEAGPLFFPALGGAAAPWWRPEARAAAAGLAHGSGPEDLLAAVVAGVGHRVLDCVDALRRAGLAVDTLRVSGKLTRIDGLVALLADLGRLTVETAPAEEVGLAGALRLARAGLDGGGREIEAPPPPGPRREPRLAADRARSARRRWLEFADAALAIGVHSARRMPGSDRRTR